MKVSKVPRLFVILTNGNIEERDTLRDKMIGVGWGNFDRGVIMIRGIFYEPLNILKYYLALWKADIVKILPSITRFSIYQAVHIILP